MLVYNWFLLKTNEFFFGKLLNILLEILQFME